MGYFWPNIYKIHSKTKPWSKAGIKTSKLRRRYARYKLKVQNRFLKISLLMNSTHDPKSAPNIDLTFSTCQKDVSTLFYDSGDIKNIENELITTKIHIVFRHVVQSYFQKFFQVYYLRQKGIFSQVFTK